MRRLSPRQGADSWSSSLAWGDAMLSPIDVKGLKLRFRSYAMVLRDALDLGLFPGIRPPAGYRPSGVALSQSSAAILPASVSSRTPAAIAARIAAARLRRQSSALG